MSTRCSTGPGTGQVAVLGHVAHQDDRDAGGFGQPGQAVHAGPDLSQASGGARQFVVGNGLDRIDDHQGRLMVDDGLLDGHDIVAGQGQKVLRHGPDPGGAPADLGQRLLGRGQEDIDAGSGHRGQHLEEEGGLADTRRAEDQRHRTGDETPGQHPIDFDHAGGHREGLAAVDVTERHRDGTVGKGRSGARAGLLPANWKP